MASGRFSPTANKLPDPRHQPEILELDGKVHIEDGMVFLVTEPGTIYRVLSSPDISAMNHCNVTVMARTIAPFVIRITSCDRQKDKGSAHRSWTMSSLLRWLLPNR